jgi:hypothetical protein
MSAFVRESGITPVFNNKEDALAASTSFSPSFMDEGSTITSRSRRHKRVIEKCEETVRGIAGKYSWSLQLTGMALYRIPTIVEASPVLRSLSCLF